MANCASLAIPRERPLGFKAGPLTGLRRRVRVPAPEEKQGVRADRDDDVRAEGVARPGGGATSRSLDHGGPTLALVLGRVWAVTAPVWMPVSESGRPTRGLGAHRACSAGRA